MPALIPQVYLHYDPAVVRTLRHRASFPRQRMDFLLLLPNRARVVIEVVHQDYRAVLLRNELSTSDGHHQQMSVSVGRSILTASLTY